MCRSDISILVGRRTAYKGGGGRAVDISINTMAELTRMALWLSMAMCGLGNLAQGNVQLGTV